jgi:hypothetical protein
MEFNDFLRNIYLEMKFNDGRQYSGIQGRIKLGQFTISMAYYGIKVTRKAKQNT